MRSLKHPGPAAPERARVAPCRAHPVFLTLRAGKSFNEAVTGALAEAGFSSGYVHLENVAVSPMRYVIPAHAPDASHVAWYSDTRTPEGVTTIEEAGAMAGLRDGAPFIHCHGTWLEPDDGRHAGHLLPHEAIVANDAQVRGWGIEGAGFVTQDDAETNFKLFAGEAMEPAAAARNALAATIRPNGDISLAIERICRAHDLKTAMVRGVGSLIGIDFSDGRHVPSYATEVFVTDGRVSDAICTLNVALVDLDGAVHEGQLTHGTNPVCITFELLILAA